MTILAALQALTEYRDNTNLFTKTLLDHGLTDPTTTYVYATHAQNVDLALADVYQVLAGSPDMREGRFAQKYNSTALLKMRRALYNKWGLELPEDSMDSYTQPSVTGKPITIGGNVWPAW